MNIDTAIYSIGISALVSLILGSLQYIINRNAAKTAKDKISNDFVNELIQRAKDLNKQEFETIRLVNADLKLQVEYLSKDNAEIKAENMRLRDENYNIIKRLRACERALTKVCPECDIVDEE